MFSGISVKLALGKNNKMAFWGLMCVVSPHSECGEVTLKLYIECRCQH